MIQRSFARTMVQRGTGLSAEDLLAHVRHASEILYAVARGEQALDAVRPELKSHAELVGRTVGYVESLEPQVRTWIRDPENLERALEAVRHRVLVAQAAERAVQALVA
jgi:hypothetical protein